MSSFKINEIEDRLLDDEPSHLYKLYMGIRKFMDYETGIAGKHRRLNEGYLIERLSYSDKQGRRAFRCPRERVRTGLRTLEKIGLIKKLEPYVFLCIFADKDKSVQNKYNRSTTKTETITSTKKKDTNQLINNEIDQEVQPELQPYYFERYNPPPGTGGNTTLATHTSLPDQTSSQTTHCAIFPKSHLSRRNVESKRHREEAIEVLDYLNAKLGSAYRPVDGTLRSIVARLQSGATVEQAKRVIDDRYRAWHRDHEMQKFLRPKTLFAASNFENYLGGLQSQAAPQVPRAASKPQCAVCGAESEGVVQMGEKRVELCGKHCLAAVDPERYELIYGEKGPFHRSKNQGATKG